MQFIGIGAAMLLPWDWAPMPEAWRVKWYAPGTGMEWIGAALAAMGLAVGVWAALKMGASFRVHPDPNGRGLVTGGPFAFVRHPIYTALIFVALGYALSTGYAVKFVATLYLLVVLHYKAEYEEKALLSVYPDYAVYKQKTGKFVPFIP
jgi:protein-S-isoprenylcysteine O-methyltransferase Ste14